MLARSIFWISLAMLAWVYAVYPLVAWCWALLRPRPAGPGGGEPAVSVIVVAQDDGASIAARIVNLLALDYPKARLEILIGSDGSADDTEAQAVTLASDRVRVFAFSTARGKPTVLAELARRAVGEILVMADARQSFEPATVRALVAPFADPGIGAVSGELLLDSGPCATAVGGAASTYWSYEKVLRRCESRIDSTVGVTGAVYAIRRALFDPIPADTLLDDVLIPMRVVRRGFRVLFEPAARAHDRPAGGAEQEFRRKVRTLAGNFQLFAREPWLLNPWQNRLWVQTLSHKLLRLLCPAFLAGALAANFWLLSRPLGAASLAAQVVFYATALWGRSRRGRPTRKVLILPYVFCLFHWAIVVGFFRFVTGQASVTWKRGNAPERDIAVVHGSAE